ncbi:MAG: zinc-ribbon domain-containing protein [Alphaproteobacteria bacterium]|nr:zinc-ribbon domain-containing protein [Alphaproteobacteria bacterium]
MILTCEKCSTRYLLSAAALGTDGRRVRCTMCRHEWFQSPDSDDLDAPPPTDTEAAEPAEPAADLETADLTDGLAEDGTPEENIDLVSREVSLDEIGPESDPVENDLESDMPEDDIPESVRPLPEDDLSLAPLPAADTPAGPHNGVGYAAAGLAFLAFFGILVAFKGPLVKAWPPMAGLYQPLGLSVPLPGAGLLLDHVKAETAPDTYGVPQLAVSGTIVNLTDRPIALPPLAAFVMNGDEALGTHPVPLEETSLDGHGLLSFTATTGTLPDDAKDVTIRFVLSPGETPAHRAAAPPAAEQPKATHHAEPSHEPALSAHH